MSESRAEVIICEICGERPAEIVGDDGVRSCAPCPIKLGRQPESESEEEDETGG